MSTIIYTNLEKSDKKDYCFKFSFFVFLAGLLIFPVTPSRGQMSSANYTIFADSVNFAGGRGTSTSYVLEDTLGEASIDSATSTNFGLAAGYQAMTAEPFFSFTISGNSINLGTLTETALSSASLTLTTSTNAPNGYTTSMTEDGDLRFGGSEINDVTDGGVTTGSEEYGIRTSGAQGLFNNADTAITNNKTIASYSSFINGSVTTVTFRASRAGFTTAGDYSHVVMFISTANF